MTSNNAYTQYNTSKILTAAPAELTLMLYEGAIKFGNIAILSIEQGNLEKTHINIIKMQKIIDEFRITLNMEYPVAHDFDKVYEYLIKRLVTANIKKDKDIIEEVLTHLRSMRDTWKEVMRINKIGMERVQA